MASPSKMPRGTRSGRNLDSAREKMLEGMKGICFLATRRAMHCCQFWAVISLRVSSMGRVIISQDSCGNWGFGLEVVEDSLFCCRWIGSHFWLGLVFNAADAGGDEYIPPCNPPEMRRD